MKWESLYKCHIKLPFITDVFLQLNYEQDLEYTYVNQNSLMIYSVPKVELSFL